MENVPQPPSKYLVPAVLLLVLIQGFVSFGSMPQRSRITNFDTAYYYVTARNFAVGRGLSETMLWHFVGPVEKIERPAGDYWPAGWPLVLGLYMSVAGHSMSHATTFVACLSMLLPVLVFYLAYQLTQSFWPAWGAGALVIFQNRLIQTNVSTDVMLPYELMTLGALVLYFSVSRRAASPAKLVLAGVLLTLPIWLRGDGFILFAAVVFGAILTIKKEDKQPASHVAWLALGAVGVVASQVVYNLAMFGSVTPAARSLIPWMTHFDEIYFIQSDPSFANWSSQDLDRVLLEKVFWEYRVHFVEVFFKQLPWGLPLVALIGMGWGLMQSDRRRRFLVVAYAVLGFWLVPCTLAPCVANPDRFTLMVAPFLCALAASLFDLLCKAKLHWLGRLGIGAVVFVLCVSMYWPAQFVQPWNTKWHDTYGKAVPHLQPGQHPEFKPGDLVLTTDPSQVAAALDVRTVMVPKDGLDGGINRVIELYHPNYVLLDREKDAWWHQHFDHNKLVPAVDGQDGPWYRIE